MHIIAHLCFVRGISVWYYCRMNKEGFVVLMQTIANGWNTKNARMAVDCFTDDAVYIEPPDKQFFSGKDELFEYFGGKKGIDMRLTWHQLFFDENKQMGSGEYTFEMNGVIHHGVAVVEMKRGLISHWREYDTRGSLSYSEFLQTKGKRFKFTIKHLQNTA